MKTKKLEKKTAFVFKKNEVKELTKDQMNQINSGGGGNGNWSGTPGCGDRPKVGIKLSVVG